MRLRLYRRNSSFKVTRLCRTEIGRYSWKKQNAIGEPALKIDHKLKNRIRFNQLDVEAKDRLRHFHHLTSAEAALQIVLSGAIWSDEPDLCPHFTPNRHSSQPISTSPDIWLSFRFSGAAHLVPEEASAASFEPHGLYVHLYEWPDMFGLQGMRVANLRVSAPTASGLECIGFKATDAFLNRCKTDIDATLMLTRIKRMVAMNRSVRVPGTAEEKAALQAQFPVPRFGMLDRLQMRFHLWRRRLQKDSV
jgi:hypothetical protein